MSDLESVDLSDDSGMDISGAVGKGAGESIKSDDTPIVELAKSLTPRTMTMAGRAAAIRKLKARQIENDEETEAKGDLRDRDGTAVRKLKARQIENNERTEVKGGLQDMSTSLEDTLERERKKGKPPNGSKRRKAKPEAIKADERTELEKTISPAGETTKRKRGRPRKNVDVKEAKSSAKGSDQLNGNQGPPPRKQRTRSKSQQLGQQGTAAVKGQLEEKTLQQKELQKSQRQDVQTLGSGDISQAQRGADQLGEAANVARELKRKNMVDPKRPASPSSKREAPEIPGDLIAGDVTTLEMSQQRAAKRHKRSDGVTTLTTGASTAKARTPVLREAEKVEPVVLSSQGSDAKLPSESGDIDQPLSSLRIREPTDIRHKGEQNGAQRFAPKTASVATREAPQALAHERSQAVSRGKSVVGKVGVPKTIPTHEAESGRDGGRRREKSHDTRPKGKRAGGTSPTCTPQVLTGKGVIPRLFNSQLEEGWTHPHRYKDILLLLDRIQRNAVTFLLSQDRICDAFASSLSKEVDETLLRANVSAHQEFTENERSALAADRLRNAILSSKSDLRSGIERLLQEFAHRVSASLVSSKAGTEILLRHSASNHLRSIGKIHMSSRRPASSADIGKNARASPENAETLHPGSSQTDEDHSEVEGGLPSQNLQSGKGPLAVPTMTNVAELKKFVGYSYDKLNLDCYRSAAILKLCEAPGGMTVSRIHDLTPLGRTMIRNKIRSLLESGYLVEDEVTDDEKRQVRVYATSEHIVKEM